MLLLGNHFFLGTTTFSEELHCLVGEYCFISIIITLICLVYFVKPYCAYMELFYKSNKPCEVVVYSEFTTAKGVCNNAS